MPIRTKPFTEISLADVQDLIAREVREDTTLEFKRQLNLENRDQRYEFLRDVTAMANAGGGTIIYGAVEGSEGDRRGRIVAIQGQVLEPDDTDRKIQQLLRDGVDERLTGVLFKALPTDVSGERVCVLRIPSSPLAPHRITLGEKAQFYLRGSGSNHPMNTRQLRESMLLRATAQDRALELINKRTEDCKFAGSRRRDPRLTGAVVTHSDQVVLHIIPLFPREEGWDLGPEQERRLMEVRPLGFPEAFEHPFYALEGMYSRYRDRRHVLFLRDGGLEFQQYDILARGPEGVPPRFEAWRMEVDVLRALEDCERLTADGLLPLPMVISLRIMDVAGSVLQRSPHDGFFGEHKNLEHDVFLTPTVIHAWGPEAKRRIRRTFDQMWQAWHLPQSTCYYSDGEHHQYSERGYLIPRPEDTT